MTQRPWARIGLWAMACLLLTSWFPAFASTAAKEPVRVIGLGNRMIYKDNVSAAKNSAVSDALSMAVQQTLTGRLARADIAANLEVLYNGILDRPQDYIITYKVLAERRKADYYRVAVEATVNTSEMEKFLAENTVINQKNDNPSILLFISEQAPGEILPRYWWGKNPLPYTSVTEDALAEVLQKNGVQVLGYPSERPDPDAAGISFGFIHDSDAAVLLGAELKADIIVMGKAVIQQAQPGMDGQASYDARITLEAFSTETGDRIITIGQSGSAVNAVPGEGIRDALLSASSLTAADLMATIKTFWSENSRDEQTIETHIEGTDYLTSFIMLRKVLNAMNGIKDIQTKELGADHAIVDILYQGSARRLADALMLQTFDSFDIELFNITDTALAIRFVTKKDIQPVKASEMKGAYISE